MTYKDRNDAINAMASVTKELDRLQVELCEDTPYEVPSANETRERIISTFEDLQKIYDIIEKQTCEQNDITSFFYYMWNSWCEQEARIVFSDSCGGYKHYWNKWCYYVEEYGVRSAVDMLYGDLDKGNRDKLVARALQCYDGMKNLK